MEYERLIELNEKRWEDIKGNIVLEEGSFWRGSVEPSVAITIQQSLAISVSLYLCEHSKYYREAQLLDTIKMQVDFLQRAQRETGLISLFTCNLNSPPDTAFAVHGVALCYQLLIKTELSETKRIEAKLEKWLEKAMFGLISGGFHTPNHRWVISGALALLYEIFGDEKAKERVDCYITQGLDISPDGEWTERSNAVYNAACDLFLYHVARVFGYGEVLEAVNKNLELMEYMLHPDGCVVTEFSRRQDATMQMPLSELYYCVLKPMATQTKNGKFEAMAEMVLVTEKPHDFGFALLYYLLYRDTFATVKAEKLSDDYIKFLGEREDYKNYSTMTHYETRMIDNDKYHNVLRYRKNDLSITIMSAQPELFTLRYGSAKIYGMKLVMGWFGVAAMHFYSIKPVDETHYEMKARIKGVYRQPFPYEMVKDKKGILKDFPKIMPELSDGVTLSIDVRFELFDDGMDIKIKAYEYDNIFAQAVLMFDKEGTLGGEGLDRANENYSFLKDGEVVFGKDGYKIVVSGGAFEHKFTTLRNDSINRSANSVIINMQTPIEKTIKIRCSKE